MKTSKIQAGLVILTATALLTQFVLLLRLATSWEVWNQIISPLPPMNGHRFFSAAGSLLFWILGSAPMGSLALLNWSQDPANSLPKSGLRVASIYVVLHFLSAGLIFA